MQAGRLGRRLMGSCEALMGEKGRARLAADRLVVELVLLTICVQYRVAAICVQHCKLPLRFVCNTASSWSWCRSCSCNCVQYRIAALQCSIIFVCLLQYGLC